MHSRRLSDKYEIAGRSGTRGATDAYIISTNYVSEPRIFVYSIYVREPFAFKKWNSAHVDNAATEWQKWKTWRFNCQLTHSQHSHAAIWIAYKKINASSFPALTTFYAEYPLPVVFWPKMHQRAAGNSWHTCEFKFANMLVMVSICRVEWGILRGMPHEELAGALYQAIVCNPQKKTQKFSEKYRPKRTKFFHQFQGILPHLLLGEIGDQKFFLLSHGPPMKI